MSNGKIYLIGAGPGEPGLITVKGLKILQQADVVIYDYLVDKEILKYTKPGTELICGDELVKGKYSNGFTKRQDLINNLMIKKAKQGKRVVRLKNGDPLIFGRANEEIETLIKNNIEFVVIPGVSAVNASACFSGIPLTVRGISSSFVVTTGHEAAQKDGGYVNWDALAQLDTIVLYMAVENLEKIVEILLEKGKEKSTPVAVISNISKITQKLVVGTLENIADKSKSEKVLPPAIVIIGEVVKREKYFNWFRKNKKVLFTGISSERFFEKGIIFHLPLIEIRPLKDYRQIDNLIKEIKTFDWIIFSSRFGVIYFFQELFKMELDARALEGIKIAAIGNSTAGELRKYRISVDILPKKESSLGLITEFRKINIKNKKILLPRSDIADKGLTDGLSNLGAEVYPCVVYQNVMPENLPELDFNFLDEIIFSSPSTVRNFIKRYGKPPERIKIRTIGAVTKEETKKWSLTV